MFCLPCSAAGIERENKRREEKRRKRREENGREGRDGEKAVRIWTTRGRRNNKEKAEKKLVITLTGLLETICAAESIGWSELNRSG